MKNGREEGDHASIVEEFEAGIDRLKFVRYLGDQRSSEKIKVQRSSSPGQLARPGGFACPCTPQAASPRTASRHCCDRWRIWQSVNLFYVFPSSNLVPCDQQFADLYPFAEGEVWFLILWSKPRTSGVLVRVGWTAGRGPSDRAASLHAKSQIQQLKFKYIK